MSGGDMDRAIDDETLMALADGEIGAGEAARLRQAVVADPVLAARLAMFERTRAAAREAFPIDNQVPLALAAAIRAADRAPAPRAAPRRAVWQMAVAASLLFVLGAAAGWVLRAGGDGGFAQPSAALAALLDSTPSGATGTADGASVSIIATHASGSLLCREFDLSAADRRVSALACREGGAWRTRLAYGRQAAGGAFRPASGDDPISAWLLQQDSVAALDAEAERALIARAWRR